MKHKVPATATRDRLDLFTALEYDRVMDHTRSCPTCSKSGPRLTFAKLCGIGKARLINWERAEIALGRLPAPSAPAATTTGAAA